VQESGYHTLEFSPGIQRGSIGETLHGSRDFFGVLQVLINSATYPQDDNSNIGYDRSWRVAISNCQNLNITGTAISEANNGAK